MANSYDLRNLKPAEWVIGILAVAGSFGVLALLASVFNIAVPAWALGGLAGVVGVVVWNYLLQRRRGK